MTSTVKTNANTVDGSVRMINVSRPVAGNDANYYTFPTSPTTINIIWGVGDKDNAVFAQSQHMGGGGVTTLTFVSA